MTRRGVAAAIQQPISDLGPIAPAQQACRIWPAPDPQAAPAPVPIAVPHAGRGTSSVEMPTTVTELSKILAGDAMLCVGRVTKRRPNPAEPVILRPESATFSPSATMTDTGDSSVEDIALPPYASKATPIPSSESSASDRQDDPDLTRVIEAWPRLPQDVRVTICVLIETSQDVAD